MNNLLDFPPDSRWRALLQPAQARRHPGKLHLGFLAHLADRYIVPGSRVLDPMAGSGSALLLTLPPWGCAVTCNELEPQWAEACAATWAHLQAACLFPPTGRAQILCGDARALPRGGAVDSIITSPPYADTLAAEPNKDRHPERVQDRRSSMVAVSAQYQAGYDTILTSPPYADALGPGQVGKGLQAYIAEQPPGRQQGAMAGANYGRNSGPGSLLRSEQSYDAVITSPPYADALAPQRASEEIHPERLGWNANTTEGIRHLRRDAKPAQIGNLSGKRYQAAMAEVYAACVPLLVPGGTLIVVIKNIVRDKQEVDLLGAARAQLEALGLRYETTEYRRVALGPFHAIRRKRDPDAIIIGHEGALVLRKPGAAL